MEPQAELLIGKTSGDFLVVAPTRRKYPDLEDFWDGNWVDASVRIRAGAFRVEYEAQFRMTEFEAFRQQLALLHDRLEGEALFDSLEHWLEIRVVGDSKGHLSAKCIARDSCGGADMANTLHFDLSFDQTETPPMLNALDEILRRFPVIGRP
jgi:hypothetical protein